MKKIAIAFCAIIAALAIFSCSTSDSVTPSKNSLSLVVPGSSKGNSTNFLMLKDGRTANPVSGIPNFHSMKLGTKLSVAFKEGTVHNGIVDITVSSYSSASDSSFVPKPTVKDSTSIDSLAGTYVGIVYKLVPSPTNPADTASIQ